jgi:hypothetical protein
MPRHRWASGIFCGDERDRCCCREARGRRSAQQSRREFASAVSATRTGDAAVSKCEDTAEVQLNSRPGPQPIQLGAPYRHEASLQAETLCCLGRVARPRGIDRRSRDGGRAACRRASVSLTPPPTAKPVLVSIRCSPSRGGVIAIGAPPQIPNIRHHSSTIATARTQPAEPRWTLTGKQLTVKPTLGSASRLESFSIWE